MFYLCTSLSGGYGTVYDESTVNADYARPDGMNNQPGYFTTKKEIYGVITQGDLTLYYDINRLKLEGDLNWMNSDNKASVQQAFFSESMKEAEMADCHQTGKWFDGFENLEMIENLHYLNTTGVSNMEYMFRNCKSLKELDLSSFDMNSIGNAEEMFKNCSSLKTIYNNDTWANGSNWRFDAGMFEGCTSLVGGNGTKYSSEHVDGEYARPDEEGTPGYFTKYNPADNLCVVQSSGDIEFVHSEIQVSPDADNVLSLFLYDADDWYYNKVSMGITNPSEGVAIVMMFSPSNPKDFTGTYSGEEDSSNNPALIDMLVNDGEMIDWIAYRGGEIIITIGEDGQSYDMAYRLRFGEKTDYKEFRGTVVGICADEIERSEAIENVQMDKGQCTKVIENGVLYLMRNGTKYNVQGALVK